MVTHNLMTLAQITKGGITKAEAFSDLSDTFDYALPQPWLDAFAEWCETNRPEVTYHLILSSTVWRYSDGCFGKPCTCCADVFEAYARWKGSKVW